MPAKLRILIENDPRQDAALQIDAEVLAARCRSSGIDVEIAVSAHLDRVGSGGDDVDVIFSNHKIDIGAAKASFPSLRWVQVISAGVEAYLKTLPDDVILTNASGVHAEKGAEFILASVLMLNYRIPFFASRKIEAAWTPVFESVARGKVATILGVGAIGSAAVSLLKERGIHVIGVTSRGVTEVPVDECITLDAIDSVLPRTDFLISTLPLTSATQGRIGATQMDLLPEGAGIVVVGRAKVLDYEAMVERLENGRLGGAVLDVFPTEPVAGDDPIWSTRNLVMTPHCSVDDHVGYIDRCLDIFIGNLERFSAGEPMVNVVSPSKGY